MRYLFFCQIVVLVAGSVRLNAQSKGWQELTIANGLSQGMIFDLQQDSKGFIWVATKDGLNRYDGYNFKVFTNDPYNPYSLSENACSALLIDRHKRLWVGTLNKGLNLYDYHTQRFYHITIRDQTLTAGTNYSIRTLTEDPDGNIWVGTSVGRPFKVSLPPALQQHFPDKPNFTDQIQLTSLDKLMEQSNRPNLRICFRPGGEGITALQNGLYRFNWRKPGIISPLQPFWTATADILDFYDDPVKGYLFVCTTEAIMGWHQGKVKTIRIPGLQGQQIKLKAIDAKRLAVFTVNHLWLLSAEELYGKDALTEQDAYLAFPPNLYGITSLLYDINSNLWVGTSGYGIRKFNTHVNQFYTQLPQQSLSHLSIDREGRMYVRVQFAYGRLNPKTNQLEPFLDETLPEADRRQRFFMQDRQGNFWVSNANFQTHAQSLFKFSSQWQLLKKYPLPSGTGFGTWGNTTLEDAQGNLWLGVMNGKLLRFDPVAESFRVFSYLPHSSSETETYAMLREPNGTYWIGTQQGLVKAEHLPDKPVYTHYVNSVLNRQSICNDFVLSLANDPYQPDRYLWVGTKGGGLDRLDKQTGLFTHVTEKDGLPNNVIYGILVDQAKNLWLSTNRGLSQFNTRHNHFRNYTQADGLQDNEFNACSFLKSPTGELLFGGVNGLTRFQPAALARINSKPPLLNILNVRINNKPITVGAPDELLTEGIEYTTQLALRHDQNQLTFEFGVMDYTNSANNRYRYRLEGIDNDWVEAGTNRFANYAQLPSGTYQLVVSGSANGEQWSEHVSLAIRVRPPFYQTWWAYLFYGGVLALLIWVFIRLQAQRLVLQQQVVFKQQEASRLEELDTLKTQFFTNISHEFRTPLTLILGPLTDLKKRYPGESILPLMERNGNRLMALINQLLDLSKLEAGDLQIDKTTGDLAAFLRTLASSFSSLASSRHIQFAFIQEPASYWGRFDRDKIEKIITNLLSNAFKFTPAGQAVRMQVIYAEKGSSGSVTFIIDDTGIGIPAAILPKIFDRFYQVDGKANRAYEGTGIGLALVHELVKALGGTIAVVSTEGTGTTFTVQLPLEPASEPVGIPVIDLPENKSSIQRQAWLIPDQTSKETELTSPNLTAATLNPNTENVLLIIDDNADIRNYLRSIFEGNYQIVEAEDGLRGLERATDITPSLVICDLMMPRLDGFGFCQILKTQQATSHIPVVMLTAKATLEDRIEGFELGADDYLTKPFNADEIRVRVRNLLDKQERLRQYFGQQPVSGPVVSLTTDAAPVLSREAIFLQKAQQVLEVHYRDSSFGVEQFSQAMNLSSSQLLRKLKALTGLTAVEFLRQYRLERAAVLLNEPGVSVSEVAYRVGFESLPYFTKVFQERYGVSPSEYTA